MSDLSLDDQRQQMWALSSRTKVALWKYNIQRYLRNHPELTSEARQVLQAGIVLVGSPGWFDTETGSLDNERKSNALVLHKQRAKNVLPP